MGYRRDKTMNEMEPLRVYVLVTLGISAHGEVTRKNTGVTFSLHEAEAHRDADFSHEFDEFMIDTSWLEDAAMTDLALAMRLFREYVAELHAEALR